MGVESVAVIGAGTMGSGIAETFLQHGFSVTLLDREEKVLRSAEAGLRESGETGSDVLSGLETTRDYSGVASVDLVVEAVPEDIDIKAGVFEQVAEYNTGAIYVTNTSSIPVTQLAEHVPDPTTFMGMHFFNPVPVMSVVELVPGEETSNDTVETVEAVVNRIDKHPVVVEDAPGFVSNRILMPFINEAVKTLEQGIAEKEAIDTIAKEGFNHPMGPLELADFIGLDVVVDIMERMHELTGADRFDPAALLQEKVDADKLGRKTGEGFHRYEG